MFDSVASSGQPAGATAVEDEAAFDWVSIEHELRHGVEQTFGNITPSGFLALEMDADTRCPDRLTDADLVDAMVGFERLAGWAQARQARVLAEFARRRPGDDTTMVNTDKPCTLSRFAPDEVGLALTQLSGFELDRRPRAAGIVCNAGVLFDHPRRCETRDCHPSGSTCSTARWPLVRGWTGGQTLAQLKPGSGVGSTNGGAEGLHLGPGPNGHAIRAARAGARTSRSAPGR